MGIVLSSPLLWNGFTNPPTPVIINTSPWLTGASAYCSLKKQILRPFLIFQRFDDTLYHLENISLNYVLVLGFGMFYLHIHRPDCATSWFTFLLFCCIHFKPQSSISKWILNRNATQDFLLPKATTYFVRARIVVNCHLFLSFLQQLLNSLKLRLYLEKTGKFLVWLCSDLPRSQTKMFITMTIHTLGYRESTYKARKKMHVLNMILRIFMPR